MSEPIYFKHKDGGPIVVVYSLSQARNMKALGYLPHMPVADAVPFPAVVSPSEQAAPTANIRSEDEAPPMATADEQPQPPAAPTFPEELSPGEYTNPPMKPKAKVVKK